MASRNQTNDSDSSIGESDNMARTRVRRVLEFDSDDTDQETLDTSSSGEEEGDEGEQFNILFEAMRRDLFRLANQLRTNRPGPTSYNTARNMASDLWFRWSLGDYLERGEEQTGVQTPTERSTTQNERDT